ncbi:AAA family ATPase [Spiroplasma sp. SV19]|uniref:AAA family ATPase n=1 Tax=Spiroplasma sp. SV19 TaxID=2570468 RepID=UPI0024B7A6F5|nr:AAA family ATPase [Spiroplasma sp. SV19]WHQ37517.1 AAA family ATPase [Spiroplasma sp. SV19]
MKIKIKSFRNIIDELEIELEKNKITTIIGTNGSGKTNILEGIHFFVSNYKNTDVVVTSNFTSYSGIKEKELIDKKEINFTYELSDQKIREVEKYLKEIKVPLEKIKDKKILISRSKTQNGFSISPTSSLIEIYNELFKIKKEVIPNKYYSLDGESDYWPNVEEIKKHLVINHYKMETY